MAVLSMPLANSAAQRKWMLFEKPSGKPLMAPAAAAVQPVAQSRMAMIEPGAEGPVAMLVQASEGVRIVRGGAVLAAQAGGMLQVGDRVVVPAEGRAQAVFQEQDGQMLLGSFEGGTDASLAYFSKTQGACSVVFDLIAGRVDMALTSIGGAGLGRNMNSSEPGRKAVGFYCYSQAIAGR